MILQNLNAPKTTDWRINSVLYDNQSSNELSYLSFPVVKPTISWWDWLIAFSILFSLSILGYLFLFWLTKRNDISETRNEVGELGIGVFLGLTLISVSYLVHDYLQKKSIPIVLMGTLFVLFIVVSIVNDKIKQHLFPQALLSTGRLSGFGQNLKNLFLKIFLLLVIFSALPIGAFFQASTNPISTEPYIEFYLVRYFYSTKDNSANFTIGIKNHSLETYSFDIESTFNGIESDYYSGIIVRPGETMVQTFSLYLPAINGINSKANFQLISDKPSPVYNLSITTSS
jgi:hypothetical protein